MASQTLLSLIALALVSLVSFSAQATDRNTCQQAQACNCVKSDVEANSKPEFKALLMGKPMFVRWEAKLKAGNREIPVELKLSGVGKGTFSLNGNERPVMINLCLDTKGLFIPFAGEIATINSSNLDRIEQKYNDQTVTFSRVGVK